MGGSEQGASGGIGGGASMRYAPRYRIYCWVSQYGPSDERVGSWRYLAGVADTLAWAHVLAQRVSDDDCMADIVEVR